MDLPEPSDTFVLSSLRSTLLQRAAALGCSHEDAEDLVQAAFERVLPLDERHDAAGVKPLLYVVLKRLVIDRARHRRRWRTTPLDESTQEDAPLPEQSAPLPEIEHDALRAALAHCSPSDRVVFELHYLHGKHYREIAGELGIALGTVGSRLRRARLQLKAALAHRFECPEP